jgi:hypothetical protein
MSYAPSVASQEDDNPKATTALYPHSASVAAATGRFVWMKGPLYRKGVAGTGLWDWVMSINWTFKGTGSGALETAKASMDTSGSYL